MPKETPYVITNCHTHTFLLDHVPRGFLPFGLTTALAALPFQRLVVWLLRGLNPFSDRDRLSRYANFLEVGGKGAQSDVLHIIKSYYPENTRFVVLPMDMAFMGAGQPSVDIDAQHDELEELAQQSNGRVLPFLAIDPRRYGGPDGESELIKELERRIPPDVARDARGFRGIKLYPPLGYWPQDPRLTPMWAYCAANDVPVMTHCSRGGVYSRRERRAATARYSDPDNYREILTAHPGLRICLAHFGGEDDWTDYFERPEGRRLTAHDAPIEDRRHINWFSKIMQLIESGAYPGLYTDISYTIFATQRFLPTLAVILRAKPTLRSRTLFGSDYYMTETEEFDERYLSMQLRYTLGEDIFREIANVNPGHFL
ncbi:amidohydrolase [Tateyamaria omphalii]|uniref:amidohydrolase family protein n=1 Tax=Tateyamaria omphalii TaxID=299262 RepID=UPI001C99B522|nr:amidohydrolase family protein [Tateyamaria omphalii]MBY5933533.1 amidohydrolase [Tateyamaria omphalii]